MSEELTSEFAQLSRADKLQRVRGRILNEGGNEHEHFLLDELERMHAALEEIQLHTALNTFPSSTIIWLLATNALEAKP